MPNDPLSNSEQMFAAMLRDPNRDQLFAEGIARGLFTTDELSEIIRRLYERGDVAAIEFVDKVSHGKIPPGRGS
jgi:hypothetical protein